VSRVAVVTGGASGIGLGVGKRFIADGYRVALLDNNPDTLAAAGAELPDALTIQVDVSDRASVTAAFDEVKSKLGPTEILVTSAGIESFKSVDEITLDIWDRIIAVNLTGTFLCCQAVIPDMQAAKWGRIVTIASSSALSGAPKMAHYAASKGGVVGLTRALAVELARQGITVNTVPPTMVDTPMARHATETGDFPGIDVIAPMIPLGRAGTPADIAGACSYLCGPDGDYITGQMINVNGGMYI
jgi:2-hydroxycyclohexanecarboxyl-CoA dehydrogenase